MTRLHQNPHPSTPAVIGSLISCLQEPSGSLLPDWTSQLMSPIKSLEGSRILVSWGYTGSYAPLLSGGGSGGGVWGESARERDERYLRTKPFSSQCILYNAAPRLLMFLSLLLTATRRKLQNALMIFVTSVRHRAVSPLNSVSTGGETGGVKYSF